MKNVRNNQNVNKILENWYKYGENMEKYMKIWQNMCKLYKMYINIQSAANMCIHIYIYIYIYIHKNRRNVYKLLKIARNLRKTFKIRKNMEKYVWFLLTCVRICEKMRKSVQNPQKYKKYHNYQENMQKNGKRVWFPALFWKLAEICESSVHSWEISWICKHSWEKHVHT